MKLTNAVCAITEPLESVGLFARDILEDEFKKIDEDLDAKVKEDMCDNYCKYPIMNMEESDLEVVCETCPLNNMYGRKKQ